MTDVSDAGGAKNKTVLAQMRREFFSTDQPPPQPQNLEPQRVTNKYLKPENRYVPTPRPTGASVVPSQDSQVVQGFVAPQMHHAEVVHVRQDSTSTEASVEASFDTQIEGSIY